MRISDFLTAAVALASLGACTTNPSKPEAATLATADAATANARCATVADSVRASTPAGELPLAVPLASPRLPLPRGLNTGEIQTRFLVDPTGRAVRGSVTTTGASDPQYVLGVEDVIMRTRFRPPIVAGCPSWSYGDFRVRSETRMR